MFPMSHHIQSGMMTSNILFLHCKTVHHFCSLLYCILLTTVSRHSLINYIFACSAVTLWRVSSFYSSFTPKIIFRDMSIQSLGDHLMILKLNISNAVSSVLVCISFIQFSSGLLMLHPLALFEAYIIFSWLVTFWNPWIWGSSVFWYTPFLMGFLVLAYLCVHCC